jgi:hypothetical protein
MAARVSVGNARQQDHMANRPNPLRFNQKSKSGENGAAEPTPGNSKGANTWNRPGAAKTAENCTVTRDSLPDACADTGTACNCRAPSATE